jgi:hypothetical protein
MASSDLKRSKEMILTLHLVHVDAVHVSGITDRFRDSGQPEYLNFPELNLKLFNYEKC